MPFSFLLHLREGVVQRGERHGSKVKDGVREEAEETTEDRDKDQEWKDMGYVGKVN